MDFVLIHPLGLSVDAMAPMGAELEAQTGGQARVINRDLPGFGDEPAYPEGREHSVPNFASTVEGWMEEEGIERAHLAGCSMGGATALELARRGRALSTTAISPACGATAGFEARWAYNQTKLFRDAARRPGAASERLFRRRLSRPVLYFQYGHPWRVPAEAVARASSKLADAPGFDDANRSLFGHYSLIEMAAPGLAEIGSPVQILWGSRDLCLFPRQGRRVADAIPGAVLTFMPGLGHLSMLDDPELVARLTLQFARQAEPAAQKIR